MLTLACADNALFGFQSLDDFWQQEIPLGDNELILRWEDPELELPILRHVKNGVVTNSPMKVWRFVSIFLSTLEIAYHDCSASVHQIRRQLGKKTDGKLPAAF